MMGRVLVVEDDAQTAALLRMALEDEGFEVDTVADPVIALLALGTGRYTVAVADQLQPGMSELEGAAREWLMTAGRLCPTVLTTARAWALRLNASSRRSLADELGLVAILTKPYDVSSLLSCVEHATMSRGGAR